ncbi:hypothetical protein SDC9_96908 [bioreactor metagenome]|uniref:SLH domain-containing protein n=1 Tax=bioreactor metagenome TaxID=1076179 RepID=A0A645AAG2_9ZZZZ
MFIGWYKDAVCANRWNFSTDTVTANANLYAKWAENTYTVSGKVEDDQGTHTAVSNATVKVMQGNIQFGDTVTTDSNGNFTVTGVPDGTYNLVVAKDSQNVTTCIKVSGGDFIFEGSIILPRGYRNSTLDVIGSDTPNVVVDKLNDVFGDSSVYNSVDEDNVADGGTVEIKLTVQQNDNSTNKATVEASMKSNGYTAGTVLDVDLTKISTTNNGASQESSISAINDTIKIIIPLPVELQGKDNYVVYRAHDYGSGVVVDTITTRAKNGEYIEISSDKTQITAYLKYFSTYAIAYKKNSSSTSDSSGYSLGSMRSYEIASSADLGGSISPSGNITVKEGMSKTYTITADEGYCISDVLVDGESVGAVNSYTFSDVKADHKISAEFERRETSALPYYSENGKAVFVGFATDASGEMKYIAPDGVTVLFEQNPKGFTDIAGHWAKNSIDFVTERELFFGTGGSDFSPQSGMTRAMFATVIGRLYERSYGKIANSDVHTFTDVDYNAYYGNYIDWASENNIITGIGGGQFKPDREITRQEMAAILYRFDKFLNASHTDLAGTQLNYSDAADISPWATGAALYCQQTGIISGRSNGNFVPQGMATRAEVAAILQRFIESTVK